MKGRRIIPMAATAALAVSGLLAVAPAAHADWEGTITGKVLNADGTPASDVSVRATTVDDGNPATSETSYSGRTDRNGVYRVDVEQTRTYSLTLNSYTTAQVPAQNATGTVGSVTTGPSFTRPAPTLVAPPTTYAAVVSVAGGHLEDVNVWVVNTATGESYSYDDLGTDNRFYFDSLPAGNYKVAANSGYYTSMESSQTIWSGNALNQRDATPVAIGTKTDLGTLTLPASEAPGTVTGHIAVPRVAGFDEWYASIAFLDANGNWQGYGNTDAAGNFSADVAPGTYYVQAYGGATQVVNFASVVNGTASGLTPRGSNQLSWYTTAPAWYGGKTLATAKKVVVTPGGTVSGINFSLTNVLQPINKPMIKGKFKQGKKVSVTTGDWNQANNVTFSYVWKEGSKIVGTSSSLKLSKKLWKKAKKLSVSVTAKDTTGGLLSGTVTLKVAKTIKAQIKAAKKQLKQDTKKDNKALHQANAV